MYSIREGNLDFPSHLILVLLNVLWISNLQIPDIVVQKRVAAAIRRKSMSSSNTPPVNGLLQTQVHAWPVMMNIILFNRQSNKKIPHMSSWVLSCQVTATTIVHSLEKDDLLLLQKFYSSIFQATSHCCNKVWKLQEQWISSRCNPAVENAQERWRTAAASTNKQTGEPQGFPVATGYRRWWYGWIDYARNNNAATACTRSFATGRGGTSWFARFRRLQWRFQKGNIDKILSTNERCFWRPCRLCRLRWPEMYFWMRREKVLLLGLSYLSHLMPLTSPLLLQFVQPWAFRTFMTWRVHTIINPSLKLLCPEIFQGGGVGVLMTIEKSCRNEMCSWRPPLCVGKLR